MKVTTHFTESEGLHPGLPVMIKHTREKGIIRFMVKNHTAGIRTDRGERKMLSINMVSPIKFRFDLSSINEIEHPYELRGISSIGDDRECMIDVDLLKGVIEGFEPMSLECDKYVLAPIGERAGLISTCKSLGFLSRLGFTHYEFYLSSIRDKRFVTKDIFELIRYA